MRKYIDIVFAEEDRDSVFVEVEDERGFSIRVGEWVKRTDGYCALRISPEAFEVDGAPYCSYGHKTKADCNCGPIAAND